MNSFCYWNYRRCFTPADNGVLGDVNPSDITGATGDVYSCCYWIYRRFLLQLLLKIHELLPAGMGTTGDIYSCCYWIYMRCLLMLLLDLQEMSAHAITGSTGDVCSRYYWIYTRCLLMSLLELQEILIPAVQAWLQHPLWSLGSRGGPPDPHR